MSPKDEDREPTLDALGELSRHAQTRKQFLRRSAAFGLTIPLGGMLAACGAGNVGSGTKAASARSLSTDAKLTKDVNFLNWSGWIGPKEVADFRKAKGVTVHQSFYANNDELLSKLRASANQYDLADPGPNAVQVLVKTGGLEELNPAWLPNAKTTAKRFLNSKADPTDKFSIPYDWSYHGIGVRRDKVSDDIQGWADLWSLKEKYSGKITVLDDQRDVIGATLRMLGHSYNSTSSKELDAAKAKLLELKPHLLAITSTNQRELLLSGQAVITMDWNQNLVGAHAENKQADFVTPKEGTGYYVDSLVIPRGAPNLYTAHVFADFLLSPQQYKSFVETTTTAWTNDNVNDLLPTSIAKNTWLNPPTLDGLELQVDVGDATPMYSDVWTEFKSA